MKKFRYSMENILQVKIKLEDQARTAYAAARHQLNLEEEKLEMLRRRKEGYEEELRELRREKLNVRQIIRIGDAITVMEDKIELQKQAVNHAAHRLEVASIRLNQAMEERKTQEKLKEKAWEEYLLEFEAEERKEVDELVSFQYSNPSPYEEDR